MAPVIVYFHILIIMKNSIIIVIINTAIIPFLN